MVERRSVLLRSAAPPLAVGDPVQLCTAKDVTQIFPTGSAIASGVEEPLSISLASPASCIRVRVARPPFNPGGLSVSRAASVSTHQRVSPQPPEPSHRQTANRPVPRSSLRVPHAASEWIQARSTAKRAVRQPMRSRSRSAPQRCCVESAKTTARLARSCVECVARPSWKLQKQ